MRYLEYDWNKQCSLPYASATEVVEWVNCSGLLGYIDEIAENIQIKLTKQLYYFGSAKAHEYIEYPMDGVSTRITAGRHYSDCEYYFEIWDKEDMVLRSRVKVLELKRNDLSLSLLDHNVIAHKFIAYCMLYVSAMLLDDVLLNDSTESKFARTDGILYLEEGEDIMKTKVFYDEYKGHKLFAIWKVDEDGNKIGDKPEYSFGRKKAKVLAPHVGEISTFIEQNQDGARTYDTTKLSDDEQKTLDLLLSKMN
jgi:hypothetical protein